MSKSPFLSVLQKARCWLLMLLLFFIVSPFSLHAQELSLAHEALLEKGLTVHPNTIVKAIDNDFIIAGYINGMSEAWATRTDAEGNIKWRYLEPSPEKSIAQNPMYNSATVMSDDSIFLCGEMTGTKGGGLLTHLNKDGKVINEQILPQKISGKNLGAIFSCAAWQGGIVLVGVAMEVSPVTPTKDHPASIDTKAFYSIIFVDRTDRIEWSRFVAVRSEEFGLPTLISPLQITTDGGFIFTAYKFGTDVLHITTSGNVQAQKYFKGLLITVARPTNNETGIKLISTDTTSGAGNALPIILITLNDELQETGRIAEIHDPGPIKQVYRLPDQSLILFGGLWRPRYVSQANITWLDSTLKREKAMDLAKSETSFWIDAAVPLDAPGSFACVRSVQAAVRSEGARDHSLALDIVSIKSSNLGRE